MKILIVTTAFPRWIDDSRAPFILEAAQALHRKGHVERILAMHAPKSKTHENWNGTLRRTLAEMASNMGLALKVSFFGNQSQEQVNNLMKKAKVFDLPLVEEGFGVVLLEALTSGMTCIASNVGSIPDIINEQVGCLVKPDDSKYLAETIIGELTDPIKLGELSRAAYEKAQNQYNWSHISWELIVRYHFILRQCG